LNDTISSENLSDFLRGDFVKVSFRLEIGDLIDSELMQLYPFDFARDLYKKFIESNEALSMPAQEAPTPAPAPAPSPAPAPQAAAPSAAPQPAPMPQMQMPQMDMATMQAMQMQMMQQQPMPNVNVAPVQFQNFNPGINPVMQQENIDLIMDVPLEVSVELGRTNKSIKEILDFSPGTIIELNKLAGEAIDVLVNGKYVAKGEVVVIEDSFGIRLTEIVR
ncbi:MAG: flagellar motor switch protein FliN, partial [Lachnospiraceae bacterium]|nr:flagellar motor switch protein FliN [Lachnospiraceae bacterium]